MADSLFSSLLRGLDRTRSWRRLASSHINQILRGKDKFVSDLALPGQMMIPLKLNKNSVRPWVWPNNPKPEVQPDLISHNPCVFIYIYIHS
ncbi:hypothetical protein NC651_014753 [Populus alba x Populus x berolinensis]|nr:hypothetical protein NC651_014753 [Populus alba x Populus x berolinensis]